MSGKSPHIRRFLNDLVRGLARSMSRARLDAGKVGLVTDIRRLERSDIFEGVPWHHAIVCVGSGGKDRGICLARLDVVIRRIAQEVTEIRFPCRRPKLVYPCFSARELVEAEHVHDPNLGQRGGEQIRSLIDHCADQESAIRSTLNRQAVLGRDSLYSYSNYATPNTSPLVFINL